MNSEQIVMAGLDPSIHGFVAVWIEAEKAADHQVEPGDDDYGWGRNS